MSSTPFFSVVIPLYNKEKDIARTLQSVIDQKFEDFEVVIVNDGSTDNSETIARSFTDERIRIYSTENKGLSAARNYGVSKSNTDYIAFLDADDLWELNHLSTLFALIKQYPDYLWYSTSYSVIDKKGNEKPCKQYARWEEGWNGIIDNFFELNRTQWLVNMCTIVVSKNVFCSGDYFDVQLHCEEDIDFYIRMAKKYSLVYINNITMKYNTIGSSRISNWNFKNKNTLDLSKYSQLEKTDIQYKKFIDFFRYTQYVKFMLGGTRKKAIEARNGINLNNLSFKQKVLVYMPQWLLRLGILIKNN